MEFRYRAIDIDRPPPVTDMAPTQFPNPNSSFLPARSLPGSTSELNSDEAIQREIEKEQIRQEIIIAEATWKKNLIAEVLQEMAMEREMVKRGVPVTGMSLEDKLTMLINQKKLLNQNQNNNLFTQKSTGPLMQLPSLQQMPEAIGTSIMDSNKEKFIVLERADSVGRKRKADDTQTGLNENLEGKRHKAKGSASKAKSNSTTGSSKSSCLRKLGSGKQVESKPRRNFKFWCDICKVGAFSESVMRNHELGKKHMAAIATQQNETTKTDVSTSLAAREMGNKIEGGDEKKKMVGFWCEVCNIWMNSEQVLKTHRLGKKHKVLFEKQQRKPRAV